MVSPKKAAFAVVARHVSTYYKQELERSNLSPLDYYEKRDLKGYLMERCPYDPASRMFKSYKGQVERVLNDIQSVLV